MTIDTNCNGIAVAAGQILKDATINCMQIYIVPNRMVKISSAKFGKNDQIKVIKGR